MNRRPDITTFDTKFTTDHHGHVCLSAGRAWCSVCNQSIAAKPSPDRKGWIRYECCNPDSFVEFRMEAP
jgi:hypothetical protein